MSEEKDKIYLEEFRSLVEGEQASAEQFDKGVLTIEVPKAEQVKPRKIEVKATG